jgi:hypothetical protein
MMSAAEKVDETTDLEGCNEVWSQVSRACQAALSDLHDAEKHSTGARFEGVGTALDVIGVDYLVQLQSWEELQAYHEKLKEGSHLEAIEAIADLVSSRKEVPFPIRTSIILSLIELYWDTDNSKPKSVVVVAHWIKQLIHVHMEVQEDGWEDAALQILQSALKPLQEHSDVRKEWPADILAWMSTTAVSDDLEEASHAR